MSLIVGSDVSHYQSIADVDAAVRAGSKYVIVKASDGLTDDAPNGTPEHDQLVAEVRRLKARAGHYHFAQKVSQAVAEADNFLARAKAQPGDLLALDLEAMDGSWAQRVAYGLAWLNHVADKTGAKPLWYVNTYWMGQLHQAASPAQWTALMAYPLWVATAGRPAGQPGVSGWEIHQYSTGGGIDHDVANVDLAAFAIPGADADMPLDGNDIQGIWHYYETSDGKDLATAIKAIYAATVTSPPPAGQPVDVKALAAALAPLVHASVDANALAATLAPVVSANVLSALASHPLSPKP